MSMLSMDVPGCRVLTAQHTGTCLLVVVEGEVTKQACPVCGHESQTVHSRYVRRPRDLSVLGQSLRLSITARRWRCLNQACSRVTFCESFKGLVVRHGQRTERMTGLMRRLILLLSSTVGTFIAQGIGLEVSPRTLLRVVGREEVPVPTPRVLGVDDFALAKGRTYGTLLCDLETGRPIDVLPGRSKQVLLEWLRNHPGVEIVARDRASSYADAISEGAPQAIQVADRFHLVKNLTEALKEVVDRQSWALPKPTPLSVPEFDPKTVSAPMPTKRMDRAARRKAEAEERLQRRYDEVHRLRSSGMPVVQIRRLTGLAIPTIYKYLASSSVPKRAEMPRSSSPLDPFVEYLFERWQAGCHNARMLHDELVQQGCTGSLTSLRCFLQPWRAAPVPPQVKRRGRNTTTWKDMRSVLLRLPEYLRDDEQDLLNTFLALHPKLSLARTLVEQFRDLLKSHDTAAFDTWLVAAANSDLAPFQRLARTLHSDRKAVLAAISLPWSTGPVEGHITRVKLLKRIGYGRASLSLLRARILGCA